MSDCNTNSWNGKQATLRKSLFSECALREIYLRSFEIAVKDSNPLALMTSYNQRNGVYTGCSRNLVTDILRCEWGYKNIVMNDWGYKI
ncbi:glycoside hydrolase family 3 N-terminal domain-containing protein [Gemmiger sp.]